MPLYEYECKQCHHRFERIVKFSDPPEKVCPKCGGEVEQLLSAPAVQFKGSGWYVSDYAKKGGGSGKSGSGEGASSTESNSSSESKSEAKTSETKTDSSASSKSSNDTSKKPASGNSDTKK